MTALAVPHNLQQHCCKKSFILLTFRL